MGGSAKGQSKLQTAQILFDFAVIVTSDCFVGYC